VDNLKETASLISASKVTGSNVYTAAGESLGDIHDVMLDKQSGKIAYAIMSFGGFLGMGTKYQPLPWSTLTYDVQKGGYVVPMSKATLEAAPTIDTHDPTTSADRTRERTLHDYYKTRPYWDA
jgi:uncharacterized protein YrrD